MKPGWAYLRVTLWTVALLALGYGFAKTQGGFVGWYLFSVVSVIFAYVWTVVLFGTRGWSVEVKPAAESTWVGESLEVELIWRRPRWSGWLTWAHMAVDSVSLYWVVPPGECRGSRRGQTGPLSRGEYPLSPVMIEVSDFFGLCHVRRELPGGPTVQVYPQPLTDPAVLRHRRGPGIPGTLGDRPGMTPRPYRPGDRLHWIHWRATAARGTLQTRESEMGEPGRWVVCVDLRREAYGGVPEEFEEALRAVATAVLDRELFRSGGVWTTEGWWVPPAGANAPVWPAVRGALAAARWTEPSPDRGREVPLALRERVVREVDVRPGDEVVIITGEPGVADWEPVQHLWKSQGAFVILYAARAHSPEE